jgi:hypothetical protein
MNEKENDITKHIEISYDAHNLSDKYVRLAISDSETGNFEYKMLGNSEIKFVIETLMRFATAKERDGDLRYDLE